jgi:hypothetical protein
MTQSLIALAALQLASTVILIAFAALETTWSDRERASAGNLFAKSIARLAPRTGRRRRATIRNTGSLRQRRQQRQRAPLPGPREASGVSSPLRRGPLRRGHYDDRKDQQPEPRAWRRN